MVPTRGSSIEATISRSRIRFPALFTVKNHQLIMEMCFESRRSVLAKLFCQTAPIKFALAQLNCATDRSINFLKPKQHDALQKARKGDCFVALKTGYGKSLVFELLPYIEKSVIIVVCPLDVIVDQFVERFHGAERIEDLTSRVQKLEDLPDDLKYIIGHPETVTSKETSHLLKLLSPKVSHLVVDEAHCIASWGLQNGDEEPFRKAFASLRSVRSVVSNAKVLALTATATRTTREKVVNTLLMGTTYPLETVLDSPDREKVFLEVKRRLPSTGGHNVRDSYEDVLLPLFKELLHSEDQFKKTVIYLPLVWCGIAHGIALSHLPPHLHGKIAQYHAPQTKTLKQVIPQQLAQGTVLLVFATEALGMGADVSDIRRIIHITCPPSIETYLQEVGRACRDGISGVATLYVNASDMANRNVSEDVKDFCKTTACRRAKLMEHFGAEVAEVDPHNCCDNCLTVCNCSDCLVQENEIPMHGDKMQNVTKESLQSGIELMKNYFITVNDAVHDSLFPEAVTGLSLKFAETLVNDFCGNDKDVDLLFEMYPNVNMSHLGTIRALLQHIKLNL